MKDYIKLLLELIKIGGSIYKAYKRERNERKRKSIKKAIKERDLEKLNKLITGRRRRS